MWTKKFYRVLYGDQGRGEDRGLAFLFLLGNQRYEFLLFKY